MAPVTRCRSRTPAVTTRTSSAGTVATRTAPVLSAADSVRITVFGRGGHGWSPQSTVNPVVLAAMIVVRLQTIVSRETAPGETAVLTVGSLQAGTKSNIMPDHAVIQLDILTYNEPTRATILEAIRRIVNAECAASGSPKDAEFELFDSRTSPRCCSRPWTPAPRRSWWRPSPGWRRPLGWSSSARDPLSVGRVATKERIETHPPSHST
ncbi:MAG: amidohydrolase [Mycetocola sp.]|jgi:metal-dependent amidase/aminoacylase/carboxypeptidase family protein|nr:amidohydrolase [Mycetocola sp.]